MRKNGRPIFREGQPDTPPGVAGWVAGFALFLKSRGFRVFQSAVLDTLRCLGQIDLSLRGDFFNALRANLVSSDMEWAQFESLFHEYLDAAQEEPPEETRESPSGGHGEKKRDPGGEFLPDVETDTSTEADRPEERAWLEGVAYSPVSELEKKNLADFDQQDVQVAELTLKRLMAPFTVQKTRRSRRSRKGGTLDFPLMMRKSLKTGGVPLDLFYREKRKRLKRLVILADVSGSMDRYARFVMPFLLGIRGIGSRAEVFVFSTSLTPITTLIRHLSLEKALERISREVPEWSGGTRIGYSLHQFNQEHGVTLLNRRTVVVILSDGWDLGGRVLLEREMRNLRRKSHTVIWLNPLAGDPDYEPICQGMKVALPYVDHLLPADSLQSLRRVGRLLARVVTH